LQNPIPLPEDNTEYPLGVLLYYGPDDKTVTKITAEIFTSPASEPVIKRWYGDQVTTDRQVLAELGSYFKTHQVKRVVMTDKVIGCPHESGIDYPEGETCPYCPFWQIKT
jgi:hypothetical protein